MCDIERKIDRLELDKETILPKRILWDNNLNIMHTPTFISTRIYRGKMRSYSDTKHRLIAWSRP